MRRLSGEDSGFLSLELPFQPVNNLVLAVLGAGGATADPIDLEFLRRHMALRLGEVPAFRWRIQRVPLGLHHPVFIEDPDFDLDYHLRQATLPAPGGDGQLDQLCADLAERHLDQRHPLWQLTLVDGFQGDRQAVVLKIHHCLMDGFASLSTLACIFSGDDHEVAVDADLWRPECPCSPIRLVADALRDHARSARGLPALVKKTARNLAALKAQQSGAIAVPKMGVDAPPSVINRAFTSERRYARTSVALADLRLVKSAAGGSVNDVALAMVAGAFRAYLEARGSLPSQSLVASVPVGAEAPGAPARTFGNRFSVFLTSLATDVADPWQRLDAIGTVTAEAKRQLATVGPELVESWLHYIPPAIADRHVRRQYRRRLKNPDRIDTNVVISNLRGPSAPYALGKATVEAMFLVGPPNNGVGTNVTLWDYGDRILFAILTFADSVDAPAELADGLHRALAELVEIAADRSSTGPGDAA